jgi:hypothetical protein
MRPLRSRALCSRAIRFRHRHKILQRLALIERDNLVHAARAELLAVGLRDGNGASIFGSVQPNIAIICASVRWRFDSAYDPATESTPLICKLPCVDPQRKLVPNVRSRSQDGEQALALDHP